MWNFYYSITCFFIKKYNLLHVEKAQKVDVELKENVLEAKKEVSMKKNILLIP